jgi:hypothetical protein
VKENLKTLFALLGNVLFEKEVDEETKKKTIENARKLLGIAKYHDVSHLYSYAVVNNGIVIEDEDLYKNIKKRHPIAVLRYETANDEFCRLTSFLEQEKIAFVPLKGAVIREYYPEKWMRTSCDIDILVHEQDLDRAIKLLTEKCAYTFNEKGTHDVSLFSHNETHVELHFKLDEDFYDNTAGNLLSCAWDYASPKAGKEFWYEFSDEFFYLYHIYHMAKHFEAAGCGIKPFIDLYILDKKIPHDEKKRNALLEKSGLKIFADSCRRLNECWFEGAELDVIMSSMQAYIVAGGTYGNKANGVAMRQTKSGGRIKYIFERLFLPYNMLKVHYPIIEKHKYLTPLFEIVRLLRLFSPETFKKSKREFELGGMVPDKKNEKLSDLLPEIGLK